MSELPSRGSNLPRFQALQLDFAAHIRNPERNPIPAGIEKRRMDIYNRLFYNNVENFCASRFKRAKQILGLEAWHAMVRDFLHRHQSKSPYFSQISEEFIAYLATERNSESDPPFLLELCHFEWLPLYLDRLNGELPQFSACSDALTETLVASELVVVRRYVWPIHELDSNDLYPDKPAKSTWILAYRDRSDKVHVGMTNELIAQLIEALRTPMTGHDAVNQVIGSNGNLSQESMDQIRDRLMVLVESDVLLVAS